MKLRKIQALVYEILCEMPETRSSDYKLYMKVCEAHGYRPEICTLKQVFEASDIPKYESVTRCRRKLQEDFSELRATDEVKAMRDFNEDTYRQFFFDK